MTPHSSRRIRHALRRFTSGVTAFAMASVGLVGVPIIAQIAGAQPAAAGTYAPVAYVANNTGNTVTVVPAVGQLDAGNDSGHRSYSFGREPGCFQGLCHRQRPGVCHFHVQQYRYRHDHSRGRAVERGVQPGRHQGLRHHYNAGTVSVITVATGNVTATITVGTSPYSVAFTPDGTKAFVTNSGANTVTPITVATSTPGTAIAVGTAPRNVAVSPDGTKAYVTNQTANTVTPITVSSNAPGTAIAVGEHSRRGCIQP